MKPSALTQRSRDALLGVKALFSRPARKPQPDGYPPPVFSASGSLWVDIPSAFFVIAFAMRLDVV